MLNFLELKPEAFGLDISDLSLKIIKLKRQGEGFTLASFGEESVKAGIIKNGEIKDEKKLAGAIKKAISKVEGEKINSEYVIASLPEEKSFLQVIQMPRLLEEDLKSAVIYEAENYIPLPIEEVYLDSQIIPPVRNHLDHLDVLIAALPKKTVDPYVSCLKKAGLRPLALEIESLAIARALVKDQVTTSPLVLIDFGTTRTGFIVFSGCSLRFTYSIPVSSQKLTEAISRSLEVDFNTAEKLKTKYGLADRGQKEGKQVFEALIPPMIDLIEQIKKGINYYQTHSSHEHLPPNGKGVEKVLICGGGAKLKGLTSFLSEQLKTKVEVGNPWVNILPTTGQPKEETLIYEKEKSLGYVTALGLALRGMREK
jgi:type IV pilus assembly protein PilM